MCATAFRCPASFIACWTLSPASASPVLKARRIANPPPPLEVVRKTSPKHVLTTRSIPHVGESLAPT
jgi:hypothetical protein